MATKLKVAQGLLSMLVDLHKKDKHTPDCKKERIWQKPDFYRCLILSQRLVCENEPERSKTWNQVSLFALKSRSFKLICSQTVHLYCASTIVLELPSVQHLSWHHTLHSFMHTHSPLLKLTITSLYSCSFVGIKFIFLCFLQCALALFCKKSSLKPVKTLSFEKCKR